MSDLHKQPKRQMALRRGATLEGTAAELLMLLETVTADGKVDDQEAAEMQAWLTANQHADLPAIAFLQGTLTQILADGIVTPDERKELHRAVERVLPIELRTDAKARHLASEAEEKAGARVRDQQAKELERIAAKASRPATSANFMVAGVLYENRVSTIDSFLVVGKSVRLRREPQNAFDANAIAIYIDQGEIGYVPRDYARMLARWIDGGARVEAHCTKILAGRLAPIPVVQVYLYDFQCQSLFLPFFCPFSEDLNETTFSSHFETAGSF